MKNWLKRLAPRFCRKTRRENCIPDDPLDLPLVRFSDHPQDSWTVRSACQGTSIWGASGAGKSSSSGRLIAQAFLRAGAGGLVLCCKREEPQIWRSYCEATGRLDDLVLFEPSSPFRFNPLLYEFSRSEGGITENVAQLVASLAEVVDRQGGRPTADFWSRALKQIVRNATDLAAQAYGRPTLELIYQIVSTAPQSPEEVESVDWQKKSFCFQAIRFGETRDKTEMQKADWPQIVRYWLNEFASLSPRTRSCIQSMLTTLIEPFLRGHMRQLFGGGINIDPEVTFDGKILVVALPTKVYGELGALAGVLWKSLWQQAAERRNINRHPKPVFCWMDEAQHFVSKSDPTFLTTSRSARVMCVMLTQNLPNFYSALSRDETHSLLGNLSTQIWHRNSCTVTNAAAAETISRSRQLRWTAGTAMSNDRAGEESVSRNIGSSESVELQVLPGEFQNLRSGGPANNLLVDGIVFENGRIWAATGRSYLRVTFSQEDHAKRI